MITLPPPYHLIETTIDMDMNMNAKQRRQARRRNELMLNIRGKEHPSSEIDEQAMNAQRIEADPTLAGTSLTYRILGFILALAIAALIIWSVK